MNTKIGISTQLNFTVVMLNLYSHLASAIINGDESNLEDVDLLSLYAIRNFIKDRYQTDSYRCVDVSEKSELDVPEVGGAFVGNVSEFTFHINIPRVWVVNQHCGLLAMQVCAVNTATDEEILIACNEHNPSGTRDGWSLVVRTIEEGDWIEEKDLPTQCEDDPERIHFLIYC